MLIAAALIELQIAAAESIKAKRRVAQSIKSRLRQRFNLAVSEVGDPDDWHTLEIGCVSVRVQRAVRFVEGLALGEVVADDVVVVSLDEVESFETEE